MSFERELAAAHAWCDRTGEIALAHFRPDLPFEDKADGTPVTEADRTIEATLRDAIGAAFPADAILGEEEGLVGEGPRRWILDPIDATKNFMRGIPVFATLVALEDEEGLALGVVDAPALKARWWATRGGGAFRDGAPIRVSRVASLADSHIASGGVETFRQQRWLDSLVAVCARANRHRGFGDFWGHVLVAQGSVDAMIDPVVSLWDLAAVQILVEEAGGLFTTLAGERTAAGGSALSSNGLVHEEILKAFA